MKIRGRMTALAGACGLALTLSAGTAQAQNALGDGQLLDRNLQSGSGGVNTRVRDIDAQIRFSNAIVTGNAPGLASFRGNVGYLAPNDFRGRLGSNDLFPIIRDAVPPAYAAQSGLRGTDALRYQFGLTGSAASLGYRAPVALERAGSGASGIDVASGLRSTSDFLTRQSYRPIVVGVGRTDADTAAAIAASPLIGVRSLQVPVIDDPIPQAIEPLSTPLSTPLHEPSVPGRAPALEPLPGQDPTRTGLPFGQEETGQRDPTRQMGQDAAGFTGLGAPSTQLTPRDRRVSAYTGLEPFARGVSRPGQEPPTRMDLAATPTMMTPQSVAHRSAVDRLRQELDATLAGVEPPTRADTRVETGVDTQTEAPLTGTPLEQRLEELRRRLAGEPALEPAEGPLLREEEPRPARPRPGEPEARTPEEERAREEARRESLRAAGITFNPQTIEALRRSRTTIRDLSTPSVASNMVYAENMAAGQSLLAQGRYFDAEERFVRAAAAIPGEPMASVGRIHAQIGAGLFMSGSMNLRTLLATNPELLPVRYAANLLPSPERWGAIREQLVARVNGDDPGAARAGALLLAYLGYQFGDEAAVSQGLDSLRKGPEMQVASEAALVELLSAVWLNAPPAQSPTE